MLDIKDISKSYFKGPETFIAVSNLSLKISRGDYLLITGHSGAGKSTLLYIIGGLIHPDSGVVLFNGTDIFRQNGNFLTHFRKERIGFMFQQFHLMPYLTVWENILLGCNDRTGKGEIDRYMETCMIDHLGKKYPSELSVGEKQRTAFLRAIISKPDILLADEPTGNLDPENSHILMGLLKDFNSNGGTVVVVSHNPEAASGNVKRIILDHGKILN